MVKNRIAILTGAGDVPGLNPVIKTVTYRSSENDIEVIGLRRGWEALTHLNLEDATSMRRYIKTLDRENTRTIDRRGGTVLHSSRTNPSKMSKLPDHLAQILGIEAHRQSCRADQIAEHERELAPLGARRDGGGQRRPGGA